jgi:hypothetical protein
MSAARPGHARRELARRSGGWIEVALYWCSTDDRTSIVLWRTDSGESLAFPVPRDRALDAFYHPFAHLPRRCGGRFGTRDRGGRA